MTQNGKSLSAKRNDLPPRRRQPSGEVERKLVDPRVVLEIERVTQRVVAEVRRVRAVVSAAGPADPRDQVLASVTNLGQVLGRRFDPRVGRARGPRLVLIGLRRLDVVDGGGETPELELVPRRRRGRLLAFAIHCWYSTTTRRRRTVIQSERGIERAMRVVLVFGGGCLVRNWEWAGHI